MSWHLVHVGKQKPSPSLVTSRKGGPGCVWHPILLFPLLLCKIRGLSAEMDSPVHSIPQALELRKRRLRLVTTSPSSHSEDGGLAKSGQASWSCQSRRVWAGQGGGSSRQTEGMSHRLLQLPGCRLLVLNVDSSWAKEFCWGNKINRQLVRGPKNSMWIGRLCKGPISCQEGGPLFLSCGAGSQAPVGLGESGG